MVSEDHWPVHNVRLSQWCCWWFISFGKWHCITWHKVPDSLKGHGTLIFWGLSSPLVVLDSPWRWRYYDPFKCWDLLVLRCGITSTGPKVLYHPRKLQSLIVSLLGDANLFQSVLTYKRTVPNIWDRTCHKWNILFGTVLLMYIRTISM
jgi:hypothetical protein